MRDKAGLRGTHGQENYPHFSGLSGYIYLGRARLFFFLPAMKGQLSLIRESPEYSGFPCKEHFVSQPTVPSDFTQHSTYTYLLPKPDLGRRLQELSKTPSRDSSFDELLE